MTTARTLPWAAAARAGRPASGPLTVAWAPTLPDLLVEAHELTIQWRTDAADPWLVPSFAGLVAQARADQVLRAVSARTNLVLAGTTAEVVGDGPIADALCSALTRIGTRVVRVSTDPRTALRASLGGLSAAAAPGTAHYVFATGEAHDPLDPAGLTGVVADASVTGALSPHEAAPARPGVDRVGEREAWVIDIPPAFGDASPEQRRMTDALVTLSILAASGVADLDRAFAEAVTA